MAGDLGLVQFSSWRFARGRARRTTIKEKPLSCGDERRTVVSPRLGGRLRQAVVQLLLAACPRRLHRRLAAPGACGPAPTTNRTDAVAGPSVRMRAASSMPDPRMRSAPRTIAGEPIRGQAARSSDDLSLPGLQACLRPAGASGDEISKPPLKLDDAYELVTTLATLARLLRNQKHAITSKFPRHKLANDGTRFGPGQAIVTPGIAKAELIAQYRSMSSTGWSRTPVNFKKYLIVERDPNDPNRSTSFIRPI